MCISFVAYTYPFARSSMDRPFIHGSPVYIRIDGRVGDRVQTDITFIGTLNNYVALNESPVFTFTISSICKPKQNVLIFARSHCLLLYNRNNNRSTSESFVIMCVLYTSLMRHIDITVHAVDVNISHFVFCDSHNDAFMQNIRTTSIAFFCTHSMHFLTHICFGSSVRISFVGPSIGQKCVRNTFPSVYLLEPSTSEKMTHIQSVFLYSNRFHFSRI